MTEIPSSEEISTKRQQIAKLAKEAILHQRVRDEDRVANL